MELRDALDFLAPAVPDPGGVWADLGAGSGTLTRALAALLGEGGRVIAVDHDAAAVRALARLGAEPGAGRARVDARLGDFTRLAALPELARGVLDGALFGNALHFVPDPAPVLLQTVARVRPGGRVVVVEYRGARANPWVPYPLEPERLAAAAEAVGLGQPVLVARRPSAYHGELYCAVLERT